MIIERHGVLLVVVGDFEESYIYLSRQVIETLRVIINSGDICRGDLSQLSYRGAGMDSKIIGAYGRDTLNDNGELLLSFANNHDLALLWTR